MIGVLFRVEARVEDMSRFLIAAVIAIVTAAMAIIGMRGVDAGAARPTELALGLGAAAIYAAPTVTRLDTAKAAFPSQCPPNRPDCSAQPGG